jgi:hypothetical protein
MATWQLSGDYFETCTCDYLCPCLPGQMRARPTKGHCNFAFAFQVDHGRYREVDLDGLAFAVVGHTPGVMGEGNWSVGLVVDDRTRADQEEALTAIVSGQAGGPMAAVAPLISTFLGVERRPITYQRDGMRRSVNIPGVLDQAVEGVPGATSGEPMYVDNAGHPAATRLALARAARSHVNVFGIRWDDTSGRNNGHFAPFRWQG